MWDLWLQVIPFVALLVLGFVVGSARERRHFESLSQRAHEHGDIVATTFKSPPLPDQVTDTHLVIGEAVIATDYFKGFVAGLRNIVGGEVKVYQRLMERARQEALLRMLAEAKRLGATEVCNIRYETSNVFGSGRRRVAVSVEALAYGTAIVRA